MKNIAILWDIENVTPTAGSGYIQSIIDTISAKGKISYAMAFGDWNRSHIKYTAGELAANSFELIHVPASRKDSSDMSMVAHGVELIFQYAHIDAYVLITGDADFRPLLLSLRKYGKETLIICDVKNNASEDLLNMADEYLDYREIIDDGSADAAAEDTNGTEIISKPQAFQLLVETIGIMLGEKEQGRKGGRDPAIGAVKIRMKLLNSSFDERKLGYRTWKAFIREAAQNTAVRFADEGERSLCLDAAAARGKITVPEVFAVLCACIPSGDSWTNFQDVSRLLARKINFHEFGYSQFKKLALDAEKRGLVSVQNNGSSWLIKRSATPNDRIL
ncbi:NYN domain-containing protein [Treponema endosymbiont of Eucomonympha sp.]|uniref:NYN domain-containing protein n=1 Tax=Treponema endosymbiont of Eucomonympha sp. TaxID=1580831 RepID=UPI00078516AC|nr:NYN domain-containing protein [Treponema endosymbiont of Eucomonympha sp.]